MANRMSQFQRISLRAVESDGLFIMQEGRVTATPIPRNLSQSCERPSQFRSATILTTDFDCFDKIAFRVGEPILAACLLSLT
jgi:hypothetical protein